MKELTDNNHGAIAKLRDARDLINDSQQIIARANDRIKYLESVIDRIKKLDQKLDHDPDLSEKCVGLTSILTEHYIHEQKELKA